MIRIGYNQPNEAPLETHFRRISSEIDHLKNRMSNMSSGTTANHQSHWNHELFQLSQDEGKGIFEAEVGRELADLTGLLGLPSIKRKPTCSASISL